MSQKRKMALEILDSVDIFSTPQCSCGCKRCKAENQFLREKLIELYNSLERKITRQSLNLSLNSSTPEMQNNFREVSTKGCNCKKSCSSRCGCFKKKFACGNHCKCDKDLCKNAVQENLDKKSDNNDSMLSVNEKPISPISKRGMKNHDHLTVKTDNKDNKVLHEEQDENFDPMKPRYQLPRSPISIKNSLSVHDNSALNDPEPRPFPLLSVSNVDISLANAPIKSMVNDLPEELQQPIIDWEKHKAELKQCPKCRRKFHPNRLDKHKAICKGI